MTTFFLIGLCCIVAVGYASPERLPEVKAAMNKYSVVPKPSEGNYTRSSYRDSENVDDFSGKENDEEGCYPQLGCFNNGEPWSSDQRPIGAPPNPRKLHMLVHFYSRTNKEDAMFIPLYPSVRMTDVNFDWKRKSVVIIHGYEASEKNTWKEELKDAYLRHVDANVMIADWGKGASDFTYFEIVSSTRVVGRQLALFVQHLIRHHQADPRKFHLIGHGLGAQICSYLAKEVPGIGRLTALDPAQPYFEDFPKEVRLDKSDAKFVDVIHTDALPFIPNFGFGMIKPHGHVDFYVNGGFDQPGCHNLNKMNFFLSELKDTSKYAFSTLSQWFHCSHTRAYQYFIAAVNHTDDCTFWGQKAKKKHSFGDDNKAQKRSTSLKIRPVSSTCSPENCVAMGLNTEETSLRGIYVVTTLEKEPYCIVQQEQSSNVLADVFNSVVSIPKSIGTLIGII